MSRFTKPANIKQFWLAPHCGPGTLDPNDLCGFCGKTRQECAQANSESVRLHHKQACGGSGLWCSYCGRFWAQDSCGESYNTDLQSVDGTALTEDKGYVKCYCGKRLFAVETN